MAEEGDAIAFPSWDIDDEEDAHDFASAPSFNTGTAAYPAEPMDEDDEEYGEIDNVRAVYTDFRCLVLHAHAVARLCCIAIHGQLRANAGIGRCRRMHGRL